MLKALTYFDDADLQPEPKMYKEFNWEEAKDLIKLEFFKLKIIE